MALKAFENTPQGEMLDDDALDQVSGGEMSIVSSEGLLPAGDGGTVVVNRGNGGLPGGTGNGPGSGNVVITPDNTTPRVHRG